MAEPTVLVVEPDPRVRDSTAELLRHFGCRVATRASADEIVRAVRESGARIVLLAATGKRVREALDALDADPAMRDVRVVLFSSTPEQDEASERLGVPLLQKPFHPSELAALLAALQPTDASTA